MLNSKKSVITYQAFTTMKSIAIAITLILAVNVSYGQEIEAENEDAFIVKVGMGFFTRNTPENRHEINRKGWAFVMAKSREMGCTHLGGISTALVSDLKALLRGTLERPQFNTWTYWERPNGGLISLTSSPQSLVDFSRHSRGFACSRGEPTTAAERFKDIATLERELRFAELID
ncbi:MAG: hypothetical protein E6Q87_01480 [Cellvibrionales bacterium]|nr:MAG: hypothetical protein E6Q87_01480 [Cellvibrionales bacterium]